MDGSLRYRNVTDSHQHNWRNQHNYKEMTPPHGNSYHVNCLIDWTRKGGNGILKQKSLLYIRSQPDDNTYYTDGSNDGTRVAAAVVHKEKEILIRINDSASVLDAEMTVIRVALETPVKQETRLQYTQTL